MKIVLAYSGGLDTSIILTWLKERYGAEVIAYAADLGQGEEVAPIRKKAMKTGASKCYIVDLKETFTRDYVFPMLRAGAMYEGQYYLGTSIARPCIAAAQVAIARKERADAVSHGGTGKGNDQVRFELTYAALAPELKTIAPWREWDFQGRGDLVRYAETHGIPIPVTKAKPWSSDRNLFHISFEAGILEDPWKEPPPEMFVLTVAPEKAPNKPQYIEVEFKAGDPVAVDGKRMSPAKLLAHLNKVAGRHGVGRADSVESRYVGLKSHGVYETPGGTVLHAARRAVEGVTMDREVMHMRDGLMPRYAELVYYGYWFSPERRALQALVDESTRGVTGVARLKLYKGNAMVVGRRAPRSIYRPDLVSFEKSGGYDQKDATGFIRLLGLRLKIHTLAQGR